MLVYVRISTIVPNSMFMFKVPAALRKANPEVYEPKLFHFGPYAPNFFPPPDTDYITSRISSFSDYISVADHEEEHSRGWSSQSASLRLNADHHSCIKEIMVMDFVGKEAFNGLLKKICAGALLDRIVDMYPELPSGMVNAIPRESLGRLFATSAVIIVGSAINCLGARCIGSPKMRHPTINRHYAVMDASLVMENQIPILLLQLACQAFCDPKCRLNVSLVYVYDNADGTGGKHMTKESIDYMKNLSKETQLLLLVLLRCLSRATPFNIAFKKYDASQVGVKVDVKVACSSRPPADKVDLNVACSRRPPVRQDDVNLANSLHINKIEIDVAIPLCINKHSLDAVVRDTARWINRNPYKPIMAYIYDSLTDNLSNSVAGTHAVSETANSSTVPALSKRMPSASHLRRYGVTFKAISEENAPNGLKGIKYDEKTKTLTLPSIKMQDSTLPLFSNLMAYEQTLETAFGAKMDGVVQHVGSYVAFLDFLIDTEEDMEVLTEAHVLRSFTERSNASVAATWDGTVRWLHLAITEEHNRIVQKLQERCKRRWRRCWLSFKETYWERQPWLLISVAAAILLFVLTVLQTIYAIRHT